MTDQRSEADQTHADAYEPLVDGWLTLPEVADALGVGINRARQLVNERQLLAVRRGENNALMVPADFVQDGKVLKGLPGVLTLLERRALQRRRGHALALHRRRRCPARRCRRCVENRGTEVKRRAQALGF